MRGCDRGASAVECGAGTVKGARRYLEDIFPTISSVPANVPFAKGPASVPFTVGRPRRVRGRVEVFRLPAGVDEG